MRSQVVKLVEKVGRINFMGRQRAKTPFQVLHIERQVFDKLTRCRCVPRVLHVSGWRNVVGV